MNTLTLSFLETRVLGVLIEKERTVPDTYPLTLNSLVAGCNQKTSRDPVIEIGEADVQAALDALKSLSLVMETGGTRVSRYGHNLERVLRVPTQASALLTVLMLRGPQTAGELRIACERMHRFADISAVEGFLDELALRTPQALVVKLPRLPGARESRWAHTLSGMPDLSASVESAGAAAQGASLGEVAALRLQVMRLDAELAAMRSLLQRVCADLGIPFDRASDAQADQPGDR